MSKEFAIVNARLSFPNVFKKSVFEGKEGKYEATLLIPKTDTKTYDALMEAVEQLKAENKKAKLDNSDFDKFFIQDGDAISRKKEGREAYEGHWAIKASNTKRPTVINKDDTPLVEDDEVIYAGCYVHGIITLWFQNNQWGIGVNANLLGIKFVKDGEEFGDGAKVADASAFAGLPEADEEF